MKNSGARKAERVGGVNYKIKIMRFLKIFLVLAIFTSCTKEVVGPQGPAGKNGVSDIYSNILTVKSSDLKFDPIYKVWYYNYALEKKFSEKSILVVSYLSNNGFQAMPFYDVVSNYQFNVSDNTALDSPNIEFQIVNKQTIDQRPSNDFKFKISIIPVE